MTRKGLSQTPALIRRKQRAVFVFGSTILFALVVFVALLVYNDSIVQAKETNTTASVTESDETFGTVVLIAPISKLQKGTKLNSSNLREVHWPRDQVPEGAVRSLPEAIGMYSACLLYTSPSPRDATLSRMPSSA